MSWWSRQYTPLAKCGLKLYPVLIGIMFAAGLFYASELDELFLAEASGLGGCIIWLMFLNRRSAGR